ncbi:hypothetical protein JCM14469_07940 [Desulfatiferula olefinivorans]
MACGKLHVIERFSADQTDSHITVHAHNKPTDIVIQTGSETTHVLILDIPEKNPDPFIEPEPPFALTADTLFLPQRVHRQ